MTHNLLVDPLIHTNGGALTLPGLFAAMTRGEVTDFPALRPHQRPAWHMFLVQLAVLARSGQDDPLPEEEATWHEKLRRLTTEFEDDAPWHLVGEDDGTPAFLQPPDPGGVKWSEVATPDALDMLITSRNHDLKREIAHDATPQDWLFALVSLQTMEGFGGAGNYGHCPHEWRLLVAGNDRPRAGAVNLSNHRSLRMVAARCDTSACQARWSVGARAFVVPAVA